MRYQPVVVRVTNGRTVKNVTLCGIESFHRDSDILVAALAGAGETGSSIFGYHITRSADVPCHASVRLDID